MIGLGKLGKLSKGLSLALTGSMLMASSYPVLETELKVDDRECQEIDFALNENSIEDCDACKYITIIDENSKIVMDLLVDHSTHEVKNEKARKLLKKSDLVMSNSISDYYLLSR